MVNELNLEDSNKEYMTESLVLKDKKLEETKEMSSECDSTSQDEQEIYLDISDNKLQWLNYSIIYIYDYKWNKYK